MAAWAFTLPSAMGITKEPSSGAGFVIWPLEPMCMQTTVSVSVQASHTGSQ